jgi:hypothetical protein
MSNTPIDGDLNTVITAAISAKVDAAVLAALSGDEVFGRYITAALQQQVEVPDGSGYNKKRVPFISDLIRRAVQQHVEKAVQALLVEEQEMLTAHIRKALRAQAPQIADQMMNNVVDAASRSYGVKVELRWPN